MGVSPAGQETEDYLVEELRLLPSVDKLLNSEDGQRLVADYGHKLTVEAFRLALAHSRSAVIAGTTVVPADGELVTAAVEWLQSILIPTLRPLINATGVIIHTNLGRSPLGLAAMEAVAAIGPQYSNLEYNLERGGRGSREVHATHLLKRVTGAEAAFVVNNNAAAVLVMLTALCRDKEVVISRGQLVEIGGGFRVPDIMAQSGARLVEIGTTNKTHLQDYADAISDATAAILVAHHSNFKIVGYTGEPSLDDLATLAHEHRLPLLYDQGSGALIATESYGLGSEPSVPDGLRAGVDVISFSGDKLIGGPQAGILCGKADLIERIKRHPLARAVRADKLCLAALSATLKEYVIGRYEQAIPVWQMIACPLGQIEETAKSWVKRLVQEDIEAEVVIGESTVGGGSLPGSTLLTYLVAVSYKEADRLASALRENDPEIIARIAGDRLLLDPRTVLPGQAEDLLRGLMATMAVIR